jgi:hypothetical protein
MKYRLNLNLIFSLLLLVTIISNAQSFALANNGLGSVNELTNKDIVNLVSMQISPEIIVAKIRASACSFDTSTSALQELKKAGVPDSVILAMVEVPQSKKEDSSSQKLSIKPSPTTVLESTQTAPASTSTTDRMEYRILATNKTSTMEKEMNEAGSMGLRFEGMMGGETSFGGSECVVVMSKNNNGSKTSYQYKLLATNKTSTMQKEMNEAAEAGYQYRGQSVYESTFGGQEVIVIMERDPNATQVQYEYKLLATSKTSTMQKEMNEVGSSGYVYLGITVAKTLFGGDELVTILRRQKVR